MIKIKQSKLSTKFYTWDKMQVKKMLFDLGLIPERYLKYTNKVTETYKVNIVISDKDIAYIKANFKENKQTDYDDIRNSTVNGFEGNLITKFKWTT